MAWLEKRGKNYHIVFRFGKDRFKRSLKTTDEQEAQTMVSRVERRLRLIEQGDLSVSQNTDLMTLLLSDGKLNQRVSVSKGLTLHEVFQKYLVNISNGSIESNTLATVTIHLNHIQKILGPKLFLRNLTLTHLQQYVNERAKQTGRRGKSVSPVTIKKELVSFSGVWSWATRNGLVKGTFPNQGLRFPKTNEKPPFQTWKEIERQITRGGLTEHEESELWDCLFLTAKEISQVLTFINQRARQPFLYPMCVMAAHTGARRSEILRSEVRDFDFTGNTVLLRERKRAKGKRTSRLVPLSPLLKTVARNWIEQSKERYTFHRSGKPITVNEATDHFRRTLDGSKWKNIRGWHTFRHSFISNCAARGIDQRMIDAWSGHQTEEMRRRYTHLFPDSQQAAMDSVFG